jgi:hypothetical protein
MTTGAASGGHGPGTTLLKIARLLCSEHLISTVVLPTISDLQREIDVTRPNSVGRLRALWRGYCAFWTVMLVAPFASSSPQAEDVRGIALPDAIARVAVGSIIITLSLVLLPLLGAWIAVALVTGMACAILIHRWSVRHPSDIPAPTEQRRQQPQINFSSTAVEGNIGGLIFAVGSLFIVAIGMPSVIWFLFAAAAAGCALAWWLAAWNMSHPKRGLPENRIVLR